MPSASSIRLELSVSKVRNPFIRQVVWIVCLGEANLHVGIGFFSLYLRADTRPQLALFISNFVSRLLLSLYVLISNCQHIRIRTSLLLSLARLLLLTLIRSRTNRYRRLLLGFFPPLDRYLRTILISSGNLLCSNCSSQMFALEDCLALQASFISVIDCFCLWNYCEVLSMRLVTASLRIWSVASWHCPLLASLLDLPLLFVQWFLSAL